MKTAFVCGVLEKQRLFGTRTQHRLVARQKMRQECFEKFYKDTSMNEKSV